MRFLIPLAEGFEEIEAVTNIDVLRRAGIEVNTCALNEGLEVTGSHGITIKADTEISQIKADDYAGILLPGGMPGASNLRDNEQVLELIRELEGQGKIIAAICAAPIVLEKAGILTGKKATSYPGFEQEMPSCHYLEERVVQDGKLITGRGPGVALEFALAVVESLLGKEKAQELKTAMLF